MHCTGTTAGFLESLKDKVRANVFQTLSESIIWSSVLDIADDFADIMIC